MENKEKIEDSIILDVKIRKFNKTNKIEKIILMIEKNLEKIDIKMKIILK